MNPNEFKNVLRQTLQDQRLARSEKSQLMTVLESLRPNDQQLANFRSIAFSLAGESIDSANGLQIVEWLEEVTKVLQPRPSAATADVSAAYFSPQDNCPGQIRARLAQAKRMVDLCVFTITDDRLTSAILEAHDRGVRIRIITDDDKATDLGSDAARFLHAGIALRTDRSRYHMHHKFAVFDGALLLNGSYNWTRGAAENNEENFIITSDRRLVEEFSMAFDKLWKQVGTSTI